MKRNLCKFTLRRIVGHGLQPKQFSHSTGFDARSPIASMIGTACATSDLSPVMPHLSESGQELIIYFLRGAYVCFVLPDSGSRD